jgi:glycosyltransferase involved in cell wall biosynthesis
MKSKVLYVERKAGEFVSLEKAFRQIAQALPDRFETEFQQAPFGTRVHDTVRNLLLFRRKPAEIYHITGHINYLALLFPVKNTVLSIMDLRDLDRPGVRAYFLRKLYIDLPVRRLKYITAISEQIRQELIATTGCDPEKIRALDLPILGHLERPETHTFNSQEPILLQVGTMANKNIENLAVALRGMVCRLRIIGRLSHNQRVTLEANKVNFESLQGLTDEEIRLEYGTADIITFCSTYEGFGLPIIEGQAMGKPVVTSKRKPMTDTSGGAACLVDPTDPSSIREGLEKVVKDSEYRAQLRADGFKNVERFRPAKVAEQYAALYDEILSGSLNE